MWTNSSGRTPKSCSSLFDLKEVVQRQQPRPPLPPLPLLVAATEAAVLKRTGPLTPRGRHWWKMMDFLKNILVSVPRLGGVPVHALPPGGTVAWSAPSGTWQGALSCCLPT